MSMKNNPWADIEDNIEPEVSTAANQIYAGVEKKYEGPPSTHINRASSAPSCPKKLWFQRNGFDCKPIPPRGRLNLEMGNLVEAKMRALILEHNVGPGKLYSEVDFGKETGALEFPDGTILRTYLEADLTAKVGGREITAHCDGIGKRNSDGLCEIIEIKSAANFGYRDFKVSDAPDYIYQAHVLMRTGKAIELGINETRFFYMRKETSHLADRLFAFDEKIWNEVGRRFEVANQESEPPIEYDLKEETRYKKPTGRLVAIYPCSYCGYIDQCHKGIKKSFKDDQFKNQRPVYYKTKQEENKE